MYYTPLLIKSKVLISDEVGRQLIGFQQIAYQLFGLKFLPN
jgi:hypothetical protein